MTRAIPLKRFFRDGTSRIDGEFSYPNTVNLRACNLLDRHHHLKTEASYVREQQENRRRPVMPCAAIFTSAVSELHASALQRQGSPILPDVLSKEPLGPAVGQGRSSSGLGAGLSGPIRIVANYHADVARRIAVHCLTAKTIVTVLYFVSSARGIIRSTSPSRLCFGPPADIYATVSG
jgi:hypothetical protein